MTNQERKRPVKKALMPFRNVRGLFYATFVRKKLRISKEKSEVVILLSDVRDKYMQPICDHLWVSSNALAGIKLHPGERISFSAKATRYYRKDNTMDYKLCHLQAVRRLKRRNMDMRRERQYS